MQSASWQTTITAWLKRPWLLFPLLAMSFGWLFLTGIWGLGRPGRGFFGGGFDFDYLFHAGRFWLAAETPYEPAAFHRLFPEGSSFAYPPVVAPLSMLLALLPHDGAELLMIVLNLAAVAAIVWSAVTYSTAATLAPRGEARWLLAATTFLALISPFVSHVLWMGQTSLLAAAMSGLAVVASQRGKHALAGSLIALSLLKPQLSLLLGAWLFLRGPWRLRLATVVGVVVLCAWPLVVSTPFGLVEQYLESVRSYQGARFQALGYEHLFGLQALGYSLGLEAPSLTPLAVIAFAALYVARDRFKSASDVYGLLIAISLLFVFSHDYDLCALIPLIPLLWRHIGGSTPLAFACLGGLLLLYLPQRVLRPLDLPLLLRYREVLVLGYATLLCFLSLRRSRVLPATKVEELGTAAGAAEL